MKNLKVLHEVLLIHRTLTNKIYKTELELANLDHDWGAIEAEKQQRVTKWKENLEKYQLFLEQHIIDLELTW